ncbi:hypothetical protein LguiB_026487 [Lonicera macranthoides]
MWRYIVIVAKISARFTDEGGGGSDFSAKIKVMIEGRRTMVVERERSVGLDLHLRLWWTGGGQTWLPAMVARDSGQWCFLLADNDVDDYDNIIIEAQRVFGACNYAIEPSFERRSREKTSKVKASIARLSIGGGNTFIARQRTNLKGFPVQSGAGGWEMHICPIAILNFMSKCLGNHQCNLVRLEGHQEILEEDAVCEICFNALKVNEEMVKMKCKCKNEELVHEACATISNCGVCEQQFEKINLILLQLPTNDAGVTTHNNGKKKLKWFPLFIW